MAYGTSPYGGANPYGRAQNLGFGAPAQASNPQQPQQQNQQPQAGSNPYLGAQANAITNLSNQNLQNVILPGINSSAMAAGGYGGSRQGIAQGLAIQGQQQSLNNSLAQLYGSSYQNDQNNANQVNVANIGAKASMYGADKSSAASMYNANKSAQASMYGANKAAEASMYNTNANTGLGYAGLNNQLNIAGMNNATTQRGQDLNYGLGMAQNATTNRGQDLNYGLGMAQNATTNRGQDLNYNVGMANASNTANSNLMNFYTNNRQLDQNGVKLGADLTTLANQGYLGQGQGLYNLGLTAQNGAWSPYTGFNNASSPYTGFGSTTSTNAGSPGAGFLGGAIAGGQLYNLFNQPTSNKG